MTRLSEQVWSIPKSELSYHDRSDSVQLMTKTRQVNNMIDRISVLCTKNEIELLWSIWRGTVYDED